MIMTTYVLTCTQLAVTLPPWRGVDILEQVPWYPCNVYQQPVENIPQWLHAANEHHLYTPNQMQDPSTQTPSRTLGIPEDTLACRGEKSPMPNSGAACSYKDITRPEMIF